MYCYAAFLGAELSLVRFMTVLLKKKEIKILQGTLRFKFIILNFTEPINYASINNYLFKIQKAGIE